MKHFMILVLAAGISSSTRAENKTDVSLFMKADSSTYKPEISYKKGDPYLTIGHHGPAMENEWMALRIYFDKNGGIDVYNKIRPALELNETQWYPDAAKQKKGSGADYYQPPFPRPPVRPGGCFRSPAKSKFPADKFLTRRGKQRHADQSPNQ